MALAMVVTMAAPAGTAALAASFYISKQENKEEVTENPIQEEVIEVVKPKKLWLKYNINDGIIHDAVKHILSSYNGADEVYIKDTSTNKAYKLNQMITIRESLIYELETILDKANIFIQE